MKDKEMIFDINMGEIHRHLPQYWGYTKTNLFTTSNALFDFSRYLIKLHEALVDVKEYYTEEFNKNNSNTIDEYIEYFNYLIAQLNELLLKKQYLKISKIDQSNIPFEQQTNFLVTLSKHTHKLNHTAFYRDGKEILGFKEDIYEKVKPIATKFFMLEKMCSFTTRQFWKEEITDIEKLDFNKPFKIIARVVMPLNWRTTSLSNEVSEYYDDKIYSCSSLIDENHKTNLFMYNTWKNGQAAILILKYESDKFLCADFVDSYSEETINGKNPFYQELYSSPVSKVDETNEKHLKHEFFSNAVEIATPKGIINKLWGVSEINMKNAEVVGVISPNKQSEEFAQKVADEQNVKLYKFEDLEH